MKQKFASWPRSARVGSLIAAGVLALALVATAVTVVYGVAIAPAIAKATAARCHAAYVSATARSACRAGDVKEAASAERSYKSDQKQQAVIQNCEARYTATAAQLDCENGDTAGADTAQQLSDALAAAAAKKASEGTTADSPYPAGTQVPMQSTNRLDGTAVSYTEWVTDFSADWRGYDEYEAPDAGMKYVAYLVHVQATDAGVDAGTVAYDASFTDPSGNVYSHAPVSYSAKPEMPDVTLGAGQQANGIVVFAVPTSVTSGVATFGSGSVFAALG